MILQVDVFIFVGKLVDFPGISQGFSSVDGSFQKIRGEQYLQKDVFRANYLTIPKHKLFRAFWVTIPNGRRLVTMKICDV